jgi:3-oxoadipate enol-lactonase
MATHSIQSDDVQLGVHDQGDGFPILMVHGMWCDHHAFDDVAEALAGGYRIVRPDLRAHGSSALPTRTWSVLDLARDLRRILDALMLEAAVVVGHSLGGMAALHMALRYPERLRGLVLLSTSAAAESPERRTQLSLLSLSIKMGGMNRWLARKAAGAFFSPVYARRAPNQVRVWCRKVRAMKKRALLQAIEAVRTRPSLVEQLDAIATPTLVIGSRDDPVADPAHLADMARRLKNGRLQMLPGGGHALPMEHPQALDRALRQLLDDHI